MLLKKSNIFTRILKKIVKKIRIHNKTPILYQYKNFSITLPSNHLLPEYQNAHPKYDRFLPHLVKYISESDTVIDVGANVGDTLAGMVEQNFAAKYICIEADEIFYSYLQENIKKMKNALLGLQVETVKALIGKNISNVFLDGTGGTKHAVIGNEGSIKSLPLNKVISETENVRVLKSDVDGFDYDVLDSSMSVIQRHKPIIFFECQFDFWYQKNGYYKTLKTLESTGYCDWTLFDNFGEVVLRTTYLEVVFQLMEYVWQQNTGQTTRTIFYYDVLAVNGSDSKLFDKILKDWLNHKIN
jgi:FkbM family methyltransferase